MVDLTGFDRRKSSFKDVLVAVWDDARLETLQMLYSCLCNHSHITL